MEGTAVKEELEKMTRFCDHCGMSIDEFTQLQIAAQAICSVKA